MSHPPSLSQETGYGGMAAQILTSSWKLTWGTSPDILSCWAVGKHDRPVGENDRSVDTVYKT